MDSPTSAKATSRTTVSATAAATIPTTANDAQSMCMGEVPHCQAARSANGRGGTSLTLAAVTAVRRDALKLPEPPPSPLTATTSTPTVPVGASQEAAAPTTAAAGRVKVHAS